MRTVLIALVIVLGANAQEFDAASIKANPPETGFHVGGDAGSGGPGTADPGMFRCGKCTLATLISKAFVLQGYQFPGKAQLEERTYDVAAKIPAGATEAQFRVMLQSLLKDRFGLAYHFIDKKMRGYQLVVAKGGAKLNESGDGARPATVDQGGFGHGAWRGHDGLIAFGGQARFRGDHQTTADLARLFSDQLRAPVEDQTGLAGKYDVALEWSGNVQQTTAHADGAFDGAGHGDHGGGAGTAGGANSAEPSGPNLFDAVQVQLGLRLAAAQQATARVFVIDHVEAVPTAN